MNNKQFWTMGLSCMMVFGLAGCGTTQTQSSETLTPESPVTTTEVIETQTPALLEETTVDTSDVEVIELTSSLVSYDKESGELNTGDDAVGVTLSLTTEGTIESVNLNFVAGHPKSAQFQSAFQDALASHLVGQNIATASVGKLGGASYTSAAFAQALTEIQTQFAAQS